MSCRRQFSVLTGTIFEGTRVPLPVWVRAIAWLSTAPGRRDARLLAEHVGVRPDTARAMLALVDAGQDPGRAQPQG